MDAGSLFYLQLRKINGKGEISVAIIHSLREEERVPGGILFLNLCWVLLAALLISGYLLFAAF